MTREQVEERLKQLRAEQAQVSATLNAYDGAIQDCEYWLRAFDKQEVPVESEQR